MAAFASCRRSGWVRVLVVILCALFIFATVATPPAYAVGETVALFGAAAVLSASVAALGFKLSNDSDGIATLNKMVTDFAKEAWALNLLVVGNRINGLIDGMNYIKMAVHNGKTYLDERVVAWCQQWLGVNGVYNNGSITSTITSSGKYSMDSLSYGSFSSAVSSLSLSISTDYGFVYKPSDFSVLYNKALSEVDLSEYDIYFISYWCQPNGIFYLIKFYKSSGSTQMFTPVTLYNGLWFPSGYRFNDTSVTNPQACMYFNGVDYLPVNQATYVHYNTSFSGETRSLVPALNSASTGGGTSNLGLVESDSNTTGLSGTDTIGEDYKDKTLDQILDGLKEWAADWVDAGADSSTNTATGSLDLPLTVGDQAATANPALNPDVVYNPPFTLPWPDVRSGETSSSAVSEGQANADAAETATTDVAENQTVIDSLVNWALGYINPDTGLFSKFPLCVPYDAYLLVTSSLGVDAVGSDSIFGASPGDLDGVVTEGIATQSDFQPIINIEHDFELDGVTYPLFLTIDLTPWQPLVTFFREGLALLLIAELIGSEYKRIRGH